jgi:hypothetical protein
MTIFAVLVLPPHQPVGDAIKTAYPSDHLYISDDQWLISTKGTASDVSAKLGLYDPQNPNVAATGSAIVFSTNGYFGRAPTNVWEWIKVKLEAPSSG